MKKSGFMQLLKIPLITESLVHQLLTMENVDLFSGLKCILARYTAEVLEVTLSSLNKCLTLQKPNNVEAVLLVSQKSWPCLLEECLFWSS